MAEAKGINPQITTEVTEEVKEMATEVKEEVKEATAEVVEKAPFLASWERYDRSFCFTHFTRWQPPCCWQCTLWYCKPAYST
jgi:hypothetical protein